MAVFGKQSYTFRDVRGFTGVVKLLLTADTTANLATLASTLATLLSACTNAALISAIGPFSQESNADYGTSSDFSSCTDKADLVMQCADGTLHKVGIPAPIAGPTVFYADNETINVGGTAIAALVAQLTAATDHAVAPRSHSPFQTGKGGMRIKAANRRRVNINVLTPDLGGPDE